MINILRAKQLYMTFLMGMILMTLYSQHESPETYRLFYLGGQSNMDGYGYVSELPDSLNKTFPQVCIFHGKSVGDNMEGGGIGSWQELQPGHGYGFSCDSIQNDYSNRFGVELSFAARIQALYPNEKIAIIKYSHGGTSIDSLASRSGTWDPDFTGMNQYDIFLATVRIALNNPDVNGDGVEDILIPQGIIWMQGESDADHSEEVAEHYFFQLKRLMMLQRAAFHNNDLPVVIGKISDSHNNKIGKVWDYLELVQYGQEKFVKQDKHAVIVRSTQNYNYSDPWHYDSKGYIDLGARFAEAVKKLYPED